MIGAGRAPIVERARFRVTLGLRHIDGPGSKHAQGVWQDVRLAGRHRRVLPDSLGTVNSGSTQRAAVPDPKTHRHDPQCVRAPRDARGRYEELGQAFAAKLTDFSHIKMLPGRDQTKERR